MTATPGLASRVDTLAGALAAAGDLTDARWWQALREVPRHLFVPPVAWAAPSQSPGYLIDYGADPDTWMAAAYANHPIITQLDDGTADVGTGQGDFTSSLSAPDVVVRFLELLDPYDDDRVLEIGTGSGWTAGLLSHRVGDGNVTSIEVDPAVAAVAAASLKEAGRAPHLVVGDGAEGWSEGAPYDRVHVTCGVTSIPYAWVEQTRPGGVIVLPWMPEYEGGHQVRLTVRGDGTAVGRFAGGCDFMMLRAQRSTRAGRAGDWRESMTRLDPRRVARTGPGADVAVTGMLPDVSGVSAAGEGDEFRLSLWAGDSDAVVTYAPGRDRFVVQERGPRDLWQEFEAAFFTWVGWGEPGRERFGMTVTPGCQQVWLDSPERVVSPPGQS